MKATKTVDCVDCGREVEVSKFASAKLTRCGDCKIGAKYATGGRKRPSKPVKGTKQWAIDKLNREIEFTQILDTAIDKAVEDGKVQFGFKLVYGSTSIHGFKWLHGLIDGETCKLYGSGLRKARIWDFEYYTKQVRGYREKGFEKLVEAGAEFTFDQWIAGMYGVLDRNLEEFVHWNGITDGLEGDRQQQADSAIQNMVDEWNDHERKHGRA